MILHKYNKRSVNGHDVKIYNVRPNKGYTANVFIGRITFGYYLFNKAFIIFKNAAKENYKTV